MQQVDAANGWRLPAIGLGTWRLGEDSSRRAAEVAAVRTAIELGYRLIDTAEMYGEGGAESVVGEALAEALRGGVVRREDITIVSKVYPHNASRQGTVAACDRSRRRLQLDRIDLYLLHWRGAHPLRDTVAAMRRLQADGHIAHWGVSNFDVSDMEELQAATGENPGSACVTDQVYYSLGERGAGFALLPWLRARGLPLMAYSPIDQGALANDRTLAAIGAARGLSAAQIALAWVVGQPGVVAIPKAVREAHLRANLAAAAVTLTDEERQAIDARHPPPRHRTPLAMI